MIVIFVLLLWGCYDVNNHYENEIVVSKDCTNGGEKTGIQFDSDSVRCGRNGDIHFALDFVRDELFSPIAFYLFSGSITNDFKDSVWVLEPDSVMESACEKLKVYNTNLPDGFCLKKIEGNVSRFPIPSYVDYEKEKNYGSYFIYSKYGHYKAFCNVDSGGCMLRYSCVIRYDETYNFSKLPNADDAEQNRIGCAL